LGNSIKLINMKTALVCGAGGFIGSHMVKRLKKEGYWVRGVDLKKPEYSQSEADHFVVGDLRNPELVSRVTFGPNQNDIYNEHGSFDLVIQMAADMGGAGYIFTGDNDANVMHNSALVNLNMVYYCTKNKVKKMLFSSSACAYPEHIQEREDCAALKESDCFPANPDSPYGWEKIFSEILFDSFRRNYGLDVRICRFHNIFGPESCYNNGKEKAPAAVCYKVASAEEGGEVEIWGDGKQTRSFLFIDEAVEGVMRLLDGDYVHPVNIGSNEMIAINDLAKMVIDISGKNLSIKNVESNAIGVRGRNSDNTLIEEKLGWKPSRPLREGMEKLYNWINQKA
jgi:nucleoside-diphosphate-sugar epimerase